MHVNIFKWQFGPIFICYFSWPIIVFIIEFHGVSFQSWAIVQVATVMHVGILRSVKSAEFYQIFAESWIFLLMFINMCWNAALSVSLRELYCGMCLTIYNSCHYLLVFILDEHLLSWWTFTTGFLHLFISLVLWKPLTRLIQYNYQYMYSHILWHSTFSLASWV